ncbi:IGLC6 protein, partial [Polypterus senegalus]
MESTNKATLVCLAQDFYPEALEIKWQEDGKDLSSGVETSQAQEKNGVFMMSSVLTLDKAAWDANKSYTCHVEHENTSYTKTIQKQQCGQSSS